MKAWSGDVNDLPSLNGELVGILAGWGRFPIATAEAIQRRGGRVAHKGPEVSSLLLLLPFQIDLSLPRSGRRP